MKSDDLFVLATKFDSICGKALLL